MTRWSRRRASIALVLLFLAGAMGVPSLDALLFHRGGTVMGANGPHFEPEGISCRHADRCLLMRSVWGPDVSLPLAAPRETSLPAGPHGVPLSGEIPSATIPPPSPGRVAHLPR